MPVIVDPLAQTPLPPERSWECLLACSDGGGSDAALLLDGAFGGTGWFPTSWALAFASLAVAPGCGSGSNVIHASSGVPFFRNQR